MQPSVRIAALQQPSTDTMIQIPVTLLLLPLGRTDVGLFPLLCPIIFMQMSLKSKEMWGHLFLLGLISNECNILYIMYEVFIHSLKVYNKEHVVTNFKMG